MPKLSILFCTAILVFMTFPVLSQSLHFGVRGGGNLSKIGGAPFNQEYKIGYHAGLCIELDLTKTIGVQPELVFNQTNVRVSNSLSGIFKPGSRISMKYMTIPILLRVNAGKLLTFHAGPQFGILMKNHQSLLSNAANSFTSGDLSGVLGAQINAGFLRVYGRYIVGLSDISGISFSDAWTTKQIQIGVGISF